MIISLPRTRTVDPGTTGISDVIVIGVGTAIRINEDVEIIDKVIMYIYNTYTINQFNFLY